MPGDDRNDVWGHGNNMKQWVPVGERTLEFHVPLGHNVVEQMDFAGQGTITPVNFRLLNEIKTIVVFVPCFIRLFIEYYHPFGFLCGPLYLFPAIF